MTSKNRVNVTHNSNIQVLKVLLTVTQQFHPQVIQLYTNRHVNKKKLIKSCKFDKI